jgi:hypothetical protein
MLGAENGSATHGTITLQHVTSVQFIAHQSDFHFV